MNRHVKALLKHYRGYGGRKLHVFPHANGDLSMSLDTGTRSYEIILPEHEAKEMVLHLVESVYGVTFSEEDLAEFKAAQGDAPSNET